MNHKALLLSLTALSLTATPSLAQFSTNLIRNASFEDFTEMAPDGRVIIEDLGFFYTLDEWTTGDDLLTLDLYDGQHLFTTPTPAGGGQYYLLGRFTPFSMVTQTIDLSFANSQIQEGKAMYSFGAFLGSFKFIDPKRDAQQDDIATITVEFIDSDGNATGSNSIVGPNFPAEVGAPEIEGNFLGFLHAEGVVPEGTTEAIVTIELNRDPEPFAPGAFNNAAVDLPRLILYPSACTIDFNNDGTLNFFDIATFIETFTSENPAADIVIDGRFNFFDVSSFLQMFASGCP